jgi:hypothetical protein
VQLLVRWRIAGDGPLGVQLRRGALASELRDGLRAEFGFAVPGLWTAEVQLEPSAALPAEWYEQQSIRGDYLRALRRLEMNPDEPVGVGAYLAERHRELAAAVEPRGPARKRVLHAAAGLGVDLLTGEDAK